MYATGYVTGYVLALPGHLRGSYWVVIEGRFSGMLMDTLALLGTLLGTVRGRLMGRLMRTLLGSPLALPLITHRSY